MMYEGTEDKRGKTPHDLPRLSHAMLGLSKLILDAKAGSVVSILGIEVEDPNARNALIDKLIVPAPGCSGIQGSYIHTYAATAQGRPARSAEQVDCYCVDIGSISYQQLEPVVGDKILVFPQIDDEGLLRSSFYQREGFNEFRQRVERLTVQVGQLFHGTAKTYFAAKCNEIALVNSLGDPLTLSEATQIRWLKERKLATLYAWERAKGHVVATVKDELQAEKGIAVEFIKRSTT